MSQEVLWSEVCQLLKAQSSKAGDKFTELLVKAKEERLSLLTKTIEFLNAEGHELIYVSGICTFIQSILKLMIHSYQLSYDAVCDMLNFIIVEARHFSSPALVKTVSYCLEFIGSNEEVNLPVRWIEVFGKIIAVLATRGEIESNGDIVDGQEYKQEVINAICRIQWGQQNGASLIAVLREIPGIDSHDVRMILDKAGQFIRKLEPASIPPIAYQLLLLSGSTFPSIIVGYFDDYFSGVDFGTGDDAEDTALTNKKKALGTTVYHFVQRAGLCEPLLKDLMKRIKASQFHHSLIVSPFMISVSLGLTGIDYVKPVIIDAVKATILKWFMEIHLSKTLRWYHEFSGTIPGDAVSSCFSRVIDSRTSELDFLLDGLKDLGIGLLNMDQIGSKDVQLAKKQCNLVGDYLLTSVLSKEKDYLPVLMNEFLKNQNSVENMECLGRCLKKVVGPFVRKKFVGRIMELIHHLPLMTVETALPIFKSLLPVLQLSYDLLGEVMMVLRKTIWKSVEARRISVTVMILLLSNSRIVGEIPRAQYSSSQAFCSSQLTASQQTNVLGLSNKNESICFEVLSILRRFFTQQMEVREHLYIGVYNVARQNPELISFLCSHVQTQLQTYMTAPDYESIRLDKIIEFSGGQTVLLEPVGFLIQCVGCLLMKSRQIYGNADGGFTDEAPASVLGCANRIGTWIEGVSNVFQEDFNKLTSRVLPAGHSVEVSFRLKSEFIVQVMQVIEALVEYLCLGGEPKTQDDLAILFAKFKELKDGLKPPAASKKDKKGKSKKAKDKDKAVESDSTFQLSGNTTVGDFLPGPSKGSSPKKVVYLHLMATEHLSEIFGKLYAFDESDGNDTIASLRDSPDFDLFLLGILKQKINALKQREPLKEREKDAKVFNTHFGKIAHLLWDRVDCNPTPSRRDDDDEVSVVEDPETETNEFRLQLIAEMLEYLFMTFPSDRQLTLCRFLNEDPDKSYGELFAEFFKQFIRHVENGRKYVQSTKEGKGIIHLFRIFELASLELTTETTDVLNTVLNWFSKFFAGKSAVFQSDGTDLEPSHAEAILNAFLVITSKQDVITERFLPLAKLAHFLLHDLDGETHLFAPKDQSEKFWLVTLKTATTVLHKFALYVENTLNVIKDIIIGRLNCIYVDEENVATWRDNCCTMMTFLVKLLSHLFRSKFPVGPWVDVLRRTAVQFFNMMTSMTESFVSYHTKSSVAFHSKRFEALVKAIGADFKMRAEAMIHHIEGIRRKALDTGDKKYASSAKLHIAKDTKTLPALIYSIERFEQQLVVLCQKTHINFLNGMRLSAPRDFKIVYNKPQTPVPVATPPKTPAGQDRGRTPRRDSRTVKSTGNGSVAGSGAQAEKDEPRNVARRGGARGSAIKPNRKSSVEVAGPSRAMATVVERDRSQNSKPAQNSSATGSQTENDDLWSPSASDCTATSAGASSLEATDSTEILAELETLSASGIEDDGGIRPTPIMQGNPRGSVKRQLYEESPNHNKSATSFGSDESRPKMKRLGLTRRRPT